MIRFPIFLIWAQREWDMCILYKRFNDFLDSTFGKIDDVTDFFFWASLLLLQWLWVKRFRLKKMVTKLRKDKFVSQRRHQHD